MIDIDFQKYARKLLSDFSLKTTFYYNEILELGIIREPYSTFINKEIEKETNELISILENISFINPLSDRTKQSMTNFINEVRNNIEFNQSKLLLLLQSAIKLRYNYLNKPNSTLLFFIFGDYLQKPKSEVLQKLNYFIDYKVVLDRCVEHFEQFPKEIVSVYEFHSIFYNIIMEYFNLASNEELIEFFNPVFEFFNFYDEDYSVPPTEFFSDFFDDIGLEHFSKFIKNYCASKSILKIEKATLQEVLLNFSDTFKKLVNSKQSQAPNTPSKNVINLSTLETFIFNLPTNIPKIDESIVNRTFPAETNIVANHEEIDEIKKLLSVLDSQSQTEPSQKAPSEEEKNFVSDAIFTSNQENLATVEFEQNKVTEIPQTSFSSKEIGQNIYGVVENHREDTYSIVFHQENSFDNSKTAELDTNLSYEIEPTIEQTKFKNFDEIISEDKRKQFIDELFYSFEDEYKKVIEKVDKSDNLEDAIEYVNSCFTALDIFPEMPIAKEFIEIVKQKFTQSKSSE